MKIKNIIFVVIFFITGCLSQKNIKVAGAYAYPDARVDKEVYDLIVELTSSNFFQYTQAARKLIAKKTDALEPLYIYKHLTREVDGCKIAVSIPVVEIILKQTKTEWLQKNMEQSLRGLDLMIQEELDRRKKGESDGRTTNSSGE